jgi:Rieske Fe-S protein
VDEVPEQSASRRTVIAGLAAAGVGAPLLAGCGSGSVSALPTTSTSPSGVAPTTAGASPTGGSSGTPLVKASEVPVGGGVILNQAVVTQPTAGVFKAFTNVCTHQGCTVAQVQNGSIICPCHQSHFSIADGSVQSGPAPSALAPIAITTKDGEVFAS